MLAAMFLLAGPAEAQDIGEVFRKVNDSVVVIRAKEATTPPGSCSSSGHRSGAGWTGLISGPIAQILNLPQPSGYLVKSVARGSAGESVGLRGGTVLATIMGEQLVVGGDIILTVQGIDVGEAADHRRVRDILDRVPPGGEFKMKVLRLGQVIELTGRHS